MRLCRRTATKFLAPSFSFSLSLSHVCSVDGVLCSVSGKVPSLCWQPGPALQAQRVSAGPWTCNPKCPWHFYIHYGVLRRD
ncbi:hypothetical protein CSPX01_08440 [Colletotrichum filicis]|nr:hypothetical protein CSPX01_08440 [Colletotrichum filicis]